MFENNPKLLKFGRIAFYGFLIIIGVVILLSGADQLGAMGRGINEVLNRPVGEMKIIWFIFIIWLFSGRKW